MTDLDHLRIFESLPGHVIATLPGAGLRIVAVSDALLAATGMRRADVAGRDLFDAFSEAEGADHALRAALERVVALRTTEQGPTGPHPLHVRGAAAPVAGGYWRAVAAPVPAPDGRVQYVVLQIDEATQAVWAGRTEARERAQLVATKSLRESIYDQGIFAGRLDLDGLVLDANRAALDACGYVREDVLGKPFWACGWWRGSAGVQAWVKDAVARAIAGESVRGESAYFLADGTERIMQFACVPIRDTDGRVAFVAPTGIDVTERVRMNRELEASTVLEAIGEGFVALDRDWRFTYVNQRAREIVGRTPEALLGKVLWNEFPGLRGSAFERAYRAAMDERAATSLTDFVEPLRRWYDVSVYPTQGGISIYFRDATQRKQAEAERDRLVAESVSQRRMYEAALSNTPDLVYVFDLGHRFVYANEALLAMWGRTRSESLGKTCLQLGYERWHAEMHDREIDQVVATRQPIRGEVPFTGTQGRRIYDYIFVPVLGGSGEVVAVAGTTRDVTERKATEQAMRDQAERLRETDRAKDEFLATLAHELRNPLAPLRNALHVLRRENGHSPGTASAHAMMQRQVDHLVRLVDDLLETARLNRGSVTLRTERVDVAAIVRNAMETSEPLIVAGGHRLEVALPENPAWVDGDPVRLAQILANLLNNAARYTDEGGHISLTARATDAALTIDIADDGVGIDAEALPRVFEMFSRGDRTRDRGHGGLGVGLALSRRLAEMHGGSLHAHSAGPGRGSVFTLTLPLAGPPAAGATSRGTTAPDIPRRRVLVVDDNRDAADSLSMVLACFGAEVRIAQNGLDALREYEAFAPEVVLLDIGMPGMNGYEVARAIRARFPGRGTPIVALTGWGQDEDRRRARDAGFDHHLVKPADIGALQTLLIALRTGDG